jgi:hypothetical protein
MHKLKIYLDTSVINFLFADDAPELKEVTVDFFDNYINDYEVYISDIVVDEIKKTKNLTKMNLLINAINKYKLETYDDLNEEIRIIAEKYINEGIIPEKKVEDALHLAFATYFEFDILLSWNFKHLANINVQRKVLQLNITAGYNKQLLLFNPMEVIYDKGS